VCSGGNCVSTAPVAASEQADSSIARRIFIPASSRTTERKRHTAGTPQSAAFHELDSWSAVPLARDVHPIRAGGHSRGAARM
jgi:hypothetical protein